MSTQTLTSPLAQPSFAELFTPKLVTVFREGYSLANFRADLMAGLTVAIVALPLSMAIAIASGVTPARGLYTRSSAASSSRRSAAAASRSAARRAPSSCWSRHGAAHGLDGLILATMMSGVFLLAVGDLRLGTFIKFIPYPVTVGFTAGIAAIIFASQMVPLLRPDPQRRRARADPAEASRAWRAAHAIPATVALSLAAIARSRACACARAGRAC